MRAIWVPIWIGNWIYCTLWRLQIWYRHSFETRRLHIHCLQKTWGRQEHGRWWTASCRASRPLRYTCIKTLSRGYRISGRCSSNQGDNCPPPYMTGKNLNKLVSSDRSIIVETALVDYALYGYFGFEVPMEGGPAWCYFWLLRCAHQLSYQDKPVSQGNRHY